jgi:hypothetical protein
LIFAFADAICCLQLKVGTFVFCATGDAKMTNQGPWKRMDSAPKDGRPMLLNARFKLDASSKHAPVVGYWNNHVRQWKLAAEYVSQADELLPDYWMEIPKPPAAYQQHTPAVSEAQDQRPSWASSIRSEAMDEVTEEHCLICRRWPPADRAEQRLRHFTKGGLLLIPVHDICPICSEVFRVTKTRH